MSFKKATATAKAPGNPPVAKFQDGLISVSVWENTSEKGTFYSVTHERRYQDDKGWKSSQSYPAFEIQTLRKLLDMAHTAILEVQGEARLQKSETKATAG